MDTSPRTPSFRELLLRHRGRTGLTQQQFAKRVSVHWRSVQDWESGAKYPSSERLEALIGALLQAHGLTPNLEAAEAQALWAAAEREAPRMRAPFDNSWFGRLIAENGSAIGLPAAAGGSIIPDRLIARAAGAEVPERRQDWGDAPDVLGFVGRTDELQSLRRWVLDERYRLLAILGMGGIGKTSLAAKLAQDVAPSFERLYWRSLRNAPPPNEWLAGAIGFLSDQQLVPPPAESEPLTERLTLLLQLLRGRRCLLVLDNFRSVLEPRAPDGRYRTGFEGYGRLLQAVGAATHQSCMVLTSREAPPELTVLRGELVRSFPLGGLMADDVRVLLARNQLVGTHEQWAELTARFGGNGLALKVVSETIRELFGGDLGSFLAEPGTSSIFGDIRRLLTEQIENSSAAEQRVLRVLAVEREPTGLPTLLEGVGGRVSRGAVLNAVEVLRRRSLVERAEVARAATFTLQPVVLEYVTDRLVEDVAEEIERGQPSHLVKLPLIKALAKDHVRQTQERLIGAAILQLLNVQHGERGTQQRLLGLLEGWRGRPAEQQGYGPGNIINLLRLLEDQLRGLDLSRLLIRQAYLAEVDVQDASMAGAQLVETVLAEAFDFPTSVALSKDGEVLAAGTSGGEVWLWRIADRMPLLGVRAHIGPVWALSLSADAGRVASGGADAAVRLWETSTGQPGAILDGHTGEVRGVALSADGRLVASGGADGTVRLWETGGRPVATLEGHAGEVRGVALSSDGRLAASAGADATVRLWDTSTRQPLTALEGHAGEVRGVALSADGRLAASAGADATVRLWDTSTRQPLTTLEGHTGVVWAVTLSADGRFVASAGTDRTVRVWEVDSGRAVAALQGHVGMVYGVALSSDGQLVASGGTDGRVRLWQASMGRPALTLHGMTGAVRGVALSADGRLVASGHTNRTVRVCEVATGNPLATLHGNTGGVSGVALSADGRLVASGGEDGIVRIWEVATGQPVAVLDGHTGIVWAVALSADGRLVASGGTDRTLRVWEVGSGRPVRALEGHLGAVRGVALSADGSLVASGGADRTVRLWETRTGQPMGTLEGHSGMVWGVALSADGKLVASGSDDGTVRLWEASSGRVVAALRGHTGGVGGVALSARGGLAASGGEDRTVRLWELGTGQPVATLEGHTGVVWSVALSADGHLVASGSFDGTVKLWDTRSGAAPRTLRSDRRYERLDITGLAGISGAQRAALLALGALES